MDKREVDFIKKIVNTEIDREMIEVLSKSELSFDDRVEILLKKIGDKND